MKIFIQPLQFWPTANPNEPSVVMPSVIRFARLRHEGIEVFYYDAIGSARIARVDGTGLAGVWPHLLFNRLHAFRVGDVEPGIVVKSVSPKERSPARLTEALAPVITKCRADCFTIETGMACDVWNGDDLEAFAINRRRPELLLQFHGFAYVLTPHEGQFEAIRDRMLARNLSTRECPLYTVRDSSQRPDGDGKFYLFKTITVFERTLAANSDWDVRLRPNPPQRPPSVHGMDV